MITDGDARKPSIFFDGVNDLLASSTAFLNGTITNSPMTFNYVSGGNNQNFGFSGNAQDGSGGVPRLYMQRFAWSYSTNVTISYISTNTTQMLSFQHDGVNQAIVRRNGTQVGIVATQAVVSSFNGGFLCVPFQSGGFFQSGFTSEALLFSTSLSATDRVLLENSQSAFYGIAYTATVPSGFVTTWYDQSGNGRNMIQTTSDSQPSIVTTGVLNVINNKPAISLDGTNDRLFLSSPPSVAAGITLISVFEVRRTGSGRDGGIFGASDFALSQNHFGFGSGVGDWYDSFFSTSRVQVSAASYASFVPRIVSINQNGSAITGRVNGVSTVAVASSFAGNPTLWVIGSNSFQEVQSFKTYTEVILLNNPTLQNILERNQGQYYSIGVS